ncbi:diversity-generating retroelement protein Avd [Nitrosomonas sp.]|uniref:diversity-generating retroelement protein Avd n=1 Tax=Nitrosomonas sp. TaxID=42353 RepID=UPI00262F50E5|nr:diversity-generating retroelement protein Avd [Nitrosomonas sp.]
MKQSNQTMPKAVEDCHELLAWIIPKLDQFPRNRRYTLGERIENGLLLVLENLIQAAYQKSQTTYLQTANLQLDVVRHLWRLSHTLQSITHQSYGQGAERLTELGRQIGGWRKQKESNTPASAA